MKRNIVVLLVLILIPFACKKVDENIYAEKILTVELKTILIDFMKSNPDYKMFGLYYLKYSKKTISFLFSTLPFNRNVISEHNPDEIIEVEGKYILLSLGFGNLNNNDKKDFSNIISRMEKLNGSFNDNDLRWSYSKSIIINIKNGKYQIQRDSISNRDNPMYDVIEDFYLRK
jgi:hypothetical protein